MPLVDVSYFSNINKYTYIDCLQELLPLLPLALKKIEIYSVINKSIDTDLNMIKSLLKSLDGIILISTYIP